MQAWFGSSQCIKRKPQQNNFISNSFQCQMQVVRAPCSSDSLRCLPGGVLSLPRESKTLGRRELRTKEEDFRLISSYLHATLRLFPNLVNLTIFHMYNINIVEKSNLYKIHSVKPHTLQYPFSIFSIFVLPAFLFQKIIPFCLSENVT